MAKRSWVMRFLVTFDDTKTDAESVASALDTVLETARLEYFEEYGYPEFGPVEPDREPPVKGSSKDPELCAVVGCQLEGHPMRCPYDGSNHHHGRVHYECHTLPHFAPASKLRFEKDRWRQLCLSHQVELTDELHQAELDRQH